MHKLQMEELQNAFSEAISYVVIILQSSMNDAIESAQHCLRALLDSLVPADNEWLIVKIGAWLKRHGARLA